MKKVTGVHSWIDLLSDSLREAVLARMRPRRYADGAAIYLVKDPSNELYLIRSGRVRIGTESYVGAELIIAVFHPGDCFGETGMIDGMPRFNSTYATGATELLVLRKQDFDELTAEYPEIWHALSLNLCYRIRVAYGLAEDAAVLTLQQRLARLLARLAYTSGQKDEAGRTAVQDVSHEELARMLGATRQGVSRALKELEDDGDIQLSYRRILVRDLESFTAAYDSLVGGEGVVPDYGEPGPAGRKAPTRDN